MKVKLLRDEKIKDKGSRFFVVDKNTDLLHSLNPPHYTLRSKKGSRES